MEECRECGGETMKKMNNEGGEEEERDEMKRNGR